MKKYTLKPLINDSWILSLNGNRIALVSKQQLENNDIIKVIGAGNSIHKNTFKNIEELSKFLGSKIILEDAIDISGEKEIGMINNFPIKHENHYNVLLEPVPNYTRTEKSEERFAAGYYGLQFKTGWTQSFCPRLTTLVDNVYIGPFSTKLEMNHQISSKKKSIEI